MESIQHFLTRLERFEWSPLGYIDPRVLDLLAEAGRDPRFIQEAVRSWTLEDLDKRQLRCHETSTHYKWFIFYHEKLHYRVWLHQYKLSLERKLGHAEVPHNHRYSLASLIVRGGFLHHSFEQTDGKLVEVTSKQRSYLAGDTYSINWQQVHMLSRLEDRTLTLVIESPVVRHFSEAFYAGSDAAGSDAPILFHDFAGLHTQLKEEVEYL